MTERYLHVESDVIIQIDSIQRVRREMREEELVKVEIEISGHVKPITVYGERAEQIWNWFLEHSKQFGGENKVPPINWPT